MIFRLRPQRFRPGLIIFTGWLISLIALVIMLIFASRPYYGGVEEAQKEIPVYLQSDTLYVQYAGFTDRSQPNFWMEANASQASLGWLEGERQSLKAIVYPQIRIVRVDAAESMRLQLKGTAAGSYIEDAYAKAEETIPLYQWQDSLLTLFPHEYSRQNKWQGNWSEAIIYLPQGKQVVLTSPYMHHFDRSAPRISHGAGWKSYRFGSQRHWDSRMERNRDRWDRKWDRWDRRWERWERRRNN